MTTIAWDGKTLAADKRGTRQGLIGTVTKIWPLKSGEVVAVAGHLEHGLALKRWYENGAMPDKYPSFQQSKDDLSTFLVLREGQVYSYHCCPDGVPEEPINAWGSGRDFAISAMALGKTAEEAVVFAARFDAGTGNGVDSFHVGDLLK